MRDANLTGPLPQNCKVTSRRPHSEEVALPEVAGCWESRSWAALGWVAGPPQPGDRRGQGVGGVLGREGQEPGRVVTRFLQLELVQFPHVTLKAVCF